VAVDRSDVSRWFAEYLDAFAACCRGEQEAATLLDYYGVPWLVSTDAGFFALTSDDAVVSTLKQQVGEMLAAGYQRTEVLSSDVMVFNATSALQRATLSRQRGDGSEISRITASYLVADGPAGRRICVLALHSS
jgi:hypothetical protein